MHARVGGQGAFDDECSQRRNGDGPALADGRILTGPPMAPPGMVSSTLWFGWSP